MPLRRPMFSWVGGLSDRAFHPGMQAIPQGRSEGPKQALYCTLPHLVEANTSTYFTLISISARHGCARHGLLQVCLCGFRKLREEDVQVLLRSCPYLTSLSVPDCTALASLALTSPILRFLDVSRCIHISAMSLDMPGETSRLHVKCEAHPQLRGSLNVWCVLRSNYVWCVMVPGAGRQQIDGHWCTVAHGPSVLACV